ncbi:hypothetical protein HDU98_008498, partial [Podochytrium sp. JEL0797]
SNVSNTNLFWRLNTAVDGMWFWEDAYEDGVVKMPAWWDVKGFAVGDGVQFVLPFETVDRTGGLIKWNLTESTFTFTQASQPNVTDYYGQQQIEPTPLPTPPQQLPLILSLSLSLAFLTITAATLLTVRHRRRSRQRRHLADPYLHVETHTPEPQLPPLRSIWQGSPLSPRRGLFLSTTGEVTPAAAVEVMDSAGDTLSLKGKAKLEEYHLSAATLASAGGADTTSGFEEIPLTTFTSTPSPITINSGSSSTPMSPAIQQQHPSRNRINAAWRVLTGVQPVSPGGTPIVMDLGVPGGGGSSSDGGRRSVSVSAASRESLRTLSTNSRTSATGGGAGGSLHSTTNMPANPPTPPRVTRPQFFRPPERTVTNAVVVVDEEGHDLPSYDAAMGGVRVATPVRRGTGDEIVVAEAVVAEVVEVRQHAVVVGAHSPVGKDEIELRVGDHITLTPDPTDTPHSSFTRGLNANSGRTGLFPRHCITLIDDPASIPSIITPLSTDISWWREQAIRFNNALTNPASATGAAAVVAPVAVSAAVVVEGGDMEKVGGGGESVPVVVAPPPPPPQQQLGNSIVAPLAPQQQVGVRPVGSTGVVSPAAPNGGGGRGVVVMDAETVSVATTGRLSGEG